MKFSIPTILYVYFALLCLTTHAQLPTAELDAISPPIITAGETTEVTLTGSNLEDLSGLHFSNGLIKAEPVLLPKTEFQKYPRQNGTKFRITVPENAPEGEVTVRTIGYFGMSTSCPVTIASKGTQLLPDSAGVAHHERETAPSLPLDSIAYGTTDPNRIDWWKIEAKKGDRILIQARAQQIDSQTDATLTLVDSNGFELERSRDYKGRDPLIDFSPEKNGAYWIGVHDFLYRGGTKSPYQLTATKGPWIDAVFPPAGTKGTELSATIIGRNLPGGSPGEGLEIDGKPVETLSLKIPIPKTPVIPEYTVKKPTAALIPSFPVSAIGAAETNVVEISLTDLPVVTEQNDNDIPAQNAPIEIAGRFDQNGDSDTFRFIVKKGIAYRVETIGDRLSGKVDPYLLVEKVTKKEDGTETLSRIADNDDDNGIGGNTFYAGTRDASVGFTSDQDGEVKVTLANQFDSGGPDYLYRLAFREAQPDFDLIAVMERPYLDQRQMYPATPLLRKGGSFSLRVLALRKDGFNGPITLTASNLPEGTFCPEVTLSGSEKSARLVFHSKLDAPGANSTIQITGKAKIGENEITRPVRGGTLTRGSADHNADRPASRLDSQIPLAVSQEESTPAFVTVEGTRNFTVTLGETLEIPVKVPTKNDIKGNLTITPSDLNGLSKPPTLTIAEKENKGVLKLSFKEQKNVFSPKSGTWNFTLKANGVTRYKHNPQAAERAKEEQQHVEALLKKYTAASTQARSQAEAAKKDLAAKEANLASASNEAKPNLEKAVVEAKAKYEAAQKAQSEAESKQKAAETAKKEVTERATSLAKRAAQKDVNFTTYSLPLTVEIKPAPTPDKK
ncbi:MAG: hypothetical protein CMO55_20035 [Verrucomicrobiales bacterium]|nr:hypothetical protein [Verrucomicrobiales bacterium]